MQGWLIDPTVFIKSTLRQSRPNKAGLKCLFVRTCVRPSVHEKFLRFKRNL